MSCGARHTLVLTETGRVFAWGWGGMGQLGLPAETASFHVNTPTEVPLSQAGPHLLSAPQTQSQRTQGTPTPASGARSVACSAQKRDCETHILAKHGAPEILQKAPGLQKATPAGRGSVLNPACQEKGSFSMETSSCRPGEADSGGSGKVSLSLETSSCGQGEADSGGSGCEGLAGGGGGVPRVVGCTMRGSGDYGGTEEHVDNPRARLAHSPLWERAIEDAHPRDGGEVGGGVLATDVAAGWWHSVFLLKPM